MGLLFKNDLHDEFGTFGIGLSPYGAADFGEVRAVAEAVGDGDHGAFYDAWLAAGDRLAAEGEAALARGHRTSAREFFLRATCSYGSAYRPLYGAPVDPRVPAAYARQIAAFDRALHLGEPPVAPTPIPFESASMPAYLVPAAGHEREVRPLLILTNGYDATVTDMYFGSAVAAVRRAYHCLIFDGPGQGAMLYEQGVPMRSDWETVVRAAVDFALARPIVDPARIALSGWSLGGHLALRAATGEPRLAAVVADPGLWGIGAGFGQYATRLGVPADAAANLLEADDSVIRQMQQAIDANPRMHWSVVQRGFWVHGVNDLRGYLRAASEFTLDGRAEAIRCPTLLTMAENDMLAASAPQVQSALRCPTTLLRFTAAEGAGEHCEMMNRSLLNRRVLDWLDETLGK